MDRLSAPRVLSGPVAQPKQVARCLKWFREMDHLSRPVLNDPAIRDLLLARVRARYPGVRDTVIIEELGMPKLGIRVDVAVVNGALHGFEIKSEPDGLSRLAGQVAGYGQLVDFATLVVATRHLERARQELPSWWGIIEATSSWELRERRRERRNPARDPAAVVQLLWQQDALRLLKRRGGAVGLSRATREELWAAVCERYSIDEIAEVGRRALRARATRVLARLQA